MSLVATGSDRIATRAAPSARVRHTIWMSFPLEPAIETDNGIKAGIKSTLLTLSNSRDSDNGESPPGPAEVHNPNIRSRSGPECLT